MKPTTAIPVLLVLTLAIAGTASGDDAPPAPAPAAKVDLVVRAVGFKHTRGHAIARLLGPGDNVMGPGRAAAKVDIHGTDATFTFPALVPGPYGVIVFHDENDNGTCDHGAFGPTEPFGLSNGVRHGMFGPPSFDQVKFLLDPKNARIEVSVQ
jgi:uncharacterized protein (DUF2141 family)